MSWVMTSSDGVLLAPVEVLVEPPGRLEDALEGRTLGVGAALVQVLLERREQLGLVLAGHADQHPDDLHRQLEGEVAHEVEVVAALDAVEDLDGQPADLVLQAVDRTRGEQARDDAAVHGVRGRVLADEQARGHLEVLGDQVVDHPVAGDERVAVAVDALQVFVAAERVEVVLLVEVDGSLAPQARVGRLWRRVDLPVVHVVVDVGLGHRHRAALPRGARRRLHRDRPQRRAGAVQPRRCPAAPPVGISGR
jgi:hypothetical protein